MKFLAKLEKISQVWFLLFACLIFSLLRLPSLFEPYWYGDEGIYELIGYALRNGRMLYSGIWDNKPPLLYLTYSLVAGDQFGAKLLSLIAGILATIAIYFLAKKVFENKGVSILASAFFAVIFGLPILEGSIANAENFMLFFIIFAALLIWQEKMKNVNLFFAGILLSIAFLFKIVAVFDTGAFGIFLLITNYQNFKSLPKEIIRLLPIAVGFILPIALTAFYFIYHGILKDFLAAAFTQNVGYVGYGNKLIIPQGLLIAKLLALAIAILLIFFLRKRLTKAEIFVYLWSAFSLFDVFFSQRPYTHYMLMLLPSVSILFGLLFFKKVKQHIAFVWLAIILLLLIINFHFSSKTFAYYTNFVSYTTGHKSTINYERFFDGNVPRDVAIANYLKSHTTKNQIVFLWGNSAQIYKLSGTMPPGRYTVAYHVTGTKESLSETEKALETKSPKYIVVFGNAAVYPYSLGGYKAQENIVNSTIYAKL